MPFYRFKIKDQGYIEVEASEIDEAMQKAGIESYEFYEIDDSEGFKRMCLFSAIADETFD